jgi:hypothetical protein
MTHNAIGLPTRVAPKIALEARLTNAQFTRQFPSAIPQAVST